MLDLARCKDGLINALEAGGLAAEIHESTVLVTNVAAPVLSQMVVLAEHDGGPWWHLVWNPQTGDESEPEWQPVCRAADVDEIAHRLAKVLAVHDPEASDG